MGKWFKYYTVKTKIYWLNCKIYILVLTGIARFVVPFIIILLYMLRFIKDSVRELRHVVWPTRKETQKYFWLVLALIVVFWVYLFIFSQSFSSLLFWLKNNFWSWNVQNSDINFDISDVFIDEDISDETLFWEDLDSEIFWEEVWQWDSEEEEWESFDTEE